jgi:fructan beta-fructosidase
MLSAASAHADEAPYYGEKYRPQYHFTPEANWMNDPNGMVYYAGEYHLFYQYNPHDVQWGPMHWGHTVSTDLVHWTHLPVALAPDDKGDIFSGNVVVDWNNTSGLQSGAEKPLIALYTQRNLTTNEQAQAMAYSTDKGRTWTKYAGNPVLPNPGLVDFRDPKVFWNPDTNKWNMLLAAGDRVKIYTSTNLKTWTWASDFGSTDGSHGGVWECPDLFQLPVDGDPARKKWVLSVSIGNGSVNGGSGMQYFVGDFDGTTFRNNNPASKVLWTDYGSDFYAAVSWSDIPAADNRRLWLGWMSNWNYGNNLPETPFRSAMSIPRQVKLKTFPDGVRMVQSPVAEVQALRGPESLWTNQTVSSAGNSLLSNLVGDSFEIVGTFQVDTATASEFGFKVRTGKNQATTIGYNKAASQLVVDRANAGNASFSDRFAARHTAPLQVDPVTKTVTLRMFVDRSSVEVFGNDGEQSITDLLFADPNSLGLQAYAANGNVTLNKLQVYKMNNTWGTTPFVSNLSGWNKLNGMWADTIAGKQGRSAGDSMILSSQLGANFTYEGDVTVRHGNGALGAGALVFRSDADASNAYFATADVKNQSVKLWKKVNGIPTVLVNYPMALQAEKAYRIKVVTAGSNIQVFVNGGLVINTTDTSHAAGYFGLNVWDTTAAIQNVNATNRTGFTTNIKGLAPVNGTWNELSSGKQGTATGDAFVVGTDKGYDSIYEGDLTVSSGAGALVFRSDATATNAYLANVDVQNQLIKLWKKVNGTATVIAEYPTSLLPNQSYHLKVETAGSSIKVYVNNSLVINATDSSLSSGFYGMNVWNGTTTFQNVVQKTNQMSLPNFDFETGDLAGWNVVSGNAFSPASVTSDTNYWNGNDSFGQQGVYHLWGYKAAGDAGTGVLTSKTFTLGGDGQIKFRIGGGQDLANLYVALVRASDGAELFKATGQNSEAYAQVSWDASAYVGTSCYLKVVDQSTAGWGHLNLDDAQVPVRPRGSRIAE